MPVNDRLGRSEIIVSKRIPTMGRSRGVHNSNEDDPNQRSKRRRSAQSGENLEANNIGTSEGKRALYHCNYCNKDITGKIRIKCAKCPDFDLCVECFSVGAEVTPHKSNHPYRVMDNLSFPLIVPDWNADEEILLLEGLEMYGVWNWAEVAEHVGTKSKAQCIDHYNSVYLNSPCFPLPDMSHVIGKNRKELLAMAKELGEDMRGSSTSNEATPKALSPFSPSRVKIEDSGRSPSTIDVPSGDKKNPNTHKNTVSTSMGAGKKASGVSHMKDGSDGIKLEGLILSEDHSERSIGGKKPKVTGEDGPSLIELSGFNPKRQEFDPEYDNDAEQSLAEMEFKDTDTDVDRELKLRILRIYSQRLDERKRRKDFILERNLLYPNPLEKELTNEDREIYERCRVFMRFLSKEEHEALIKGMIREHKIRQKIEELQEYRAAGCHTMTEGEKYAAEKRKRETEMNMLKGKESSQSVVGGKVLQRGNRGIIKEKKEPEESAIPTDNHKPKGNNAVYTMGGPFSNLLDDWDITGLPGTNLLSAAENRLCRKNRLLPAHYLKMKDVLVMEAFNGNTMKKSDAYDMFKVDRNKVDNIYELLIRMGLLSSGQTS